MLLFLASVDVTVKQVHQTLELPYDMVLSLLGIKE